MFTQHYNCCLCWTMFSQFLMVTLKLFCVCLLFQAGQFQPAATDSAAMQQQQYYPWYQQTQQHYPGYTYPYNYYYPMAPVSKDMSTAAFSWEKFCTVTLFAKTEFKVRNITKCLSLNFQYGGAYPSNQYGVPPGPYPGTPTSNGQVQNLNFLSKAEYLYVEIINMIHDSCLGLRNLKK